MRDHLESFIRSGGNAAFFSGNTSFWQVRSEDAGRTWRIVGNIAGGPHEFGATSMCFTSAGKVIVAYDWHRVPWDRAVKTGGIRLAIIEPQ